MLLEIHSLNISTDSTHSQCGYFISMYVKMTNIIRLVLLFFVESRYLFFPLRWWISRFGMKDTLTEHRPVQYPLCLCLFTLTSTPIKEFVFVDWISVSVCKYVRGSHLNKAYSLLQQQIHQP